MVICNKVDGKPCSCELVEDYIQEFIREVSILMMKLILGTITNTEKVALRRILQRPHAREYLELYIIHSELVRVVHRM